MRPRIAMPGRLSDRHQIKVKLRRAKLHTVCEEARCPNISACFASGTATFLILGDVCTRHCRFCGVSKNRAPAARDPGEPGRVASAVLELGLRHAVVTSVTRDDLQDGGASVFAACLREIRRQSPDTQVELLVPDFCGNEQALSHVIAAGPDVFNHNIETVLRLYPNVRPQADFERSLRVLSMAAQNGSSVIKSGLMVGLGEEPTEVVEVMGRLKMAGCQIVTIGQYLQPTRESLPVHRLVDSSEFELYRAEGRKLGFRAILAGPLVRSSFHAEQTLRDSTPKPTSGSSHP